jgi:transcriptional regulator with XRE-family HTH domain
MTDKNSKITGTVSLAEIGERLKIVREALKLTLKAVQEKTAISTSYISDFERGKKFPSSKYMKELVVTFGVSADYIFSGKGEMFFKNEDDLKEIYDFGKFNEDVQEMLFYMKKVPNALFAVLEFFTDYKVKKEDFLKKYLEKHHHIKSDDKG